MFEEFPPPPVYEIVADVPLQLKAKYWGSANLTAWPQALNPQIGFKQTVLWGIHSGQRGERVHGDGRGCRFGGSAWWLVSEL